MVKQIQVPKIDLQCPNCKQKKKFNAVNGHCDGIHTILLICGNPKCKHEMLISDGELVVKK